MSCGTCVMDAAPTLTGVGIPLRQAMAAWAVGPVAQVWELLPRCPRCNKWVSPRTGICRYERCGLKGTQVAEACGWPPAGLSLLRRKAEVLAIRAETGQAPPARPEAIVDADGHPVARPAAPESLFAVAAAQAATPPAVAKNQGDLVITDALGIGAGGAKAKCRDNLAAIRLLKQLEADNRPATPDEMAILARYVGWGGLSQVFDPLNDTYAYYQEHPAVWYKRNKPEFYDEWKELKTLLTEEEWQSAKASTPNAHYTSPEVIRAMWDGLRQLGFDGEGTVLEPAAGVGHFLGCEPEEMTGRSTRAAVELDALSGRITQKLYPNANVQICGFQEANLPDGFFDVAISNVPFGNYAVYDPAFAKGRSYLSRSIHNYFFAKALDKVRPGGVVAFITSHHTLDSKDPQVREYLASKADLVGAIRLPNTAFQGNAMTQVTTDIIFLRKREEGEEPGDTSWVETVTVTAPDAGGNDVPLSMNRYFVDHPEQLMGKLAATGALYRDKELALESDGRDLGQAMSAAMKRLPAGTFRKPQARCPACKAFVSAPGAACHNPDCPLKKAALSSHAIQPVKEGALVVGEDGKIYQRQRGGGMQAVEVKPKDVARVAELVAIRDLARKVLALNVKGADDETLAAAQAELNHAYDGFVGRYGPLSNPHNKRLFAGDPDLPFMLALEDYDKDTDTAKKAGLFSRRTVNMQAQITHADTPRDALLVTLNQTGAIDWDRMAALTGLSGSALQAQLAGIVFRTPEGDWQLAEAYLSGDVRKKLREAEAAAALDPAFGLNVEALRAVQPRDLLPSEINAGLGSGWIPPADVEAFAHALFNQEVKVNYVEAMGKWLVTPGSQYFNRNAAALTSTWGTRRVDGLNLLDQALNGKIPTVYDPLPGGDGKDDTLVVNQAETLAAREMQDKIKARFKEWIWQDPDRAGRLAARYNELYNATVPRRYDGTHLTLPGIGADMPPLRHHQKDAIWRIVQSKGNTLLGHVVGAGKSYTMIGAGMELRRMGLRKKVMHCIPNHMLEQYGKDILRMYPGAKVLLVSAGDLGAADKRAQTMSRIAANDWDAVVVTHNAFEKLPVRDETFDSFLRQEIDGLDQYLNELNAQKRAGGYASRRSGEDRGRARTVKEIEKAKKRLEAKLRARAKRDAKDNTLTWEELGVDQVFVDEAHHFKNLYFPTQRTRVAGISQSESNRAFDMFIKTQYLTRRCVCGQFVGEDGVCRNCRARSKPTEGGVVFATGTPIANSIAEMYTMQRYLQLDRLRELGLGHFDAWAAQFGDTATSLEMKPSGDGYREFTRFAKFVNTPDLLKLFEEVADLQMDPTALGLARPQLAGGQAIGIAAPASPWLKEFIQACARRADRLKVVDPRVDNMLKIVSDANKAALDPRLIDPSLPDDPSSKVNKAVANIVQIYRDSTGLTVAGQDGPQNMAQMVFLDTSVPGEAGFNVYDDIKHKLIAAGIPAEEIAYIHDATSDEAKLDLFERVNAGKVRVLMGSTAKMGSGTNAQRRLIALHHLDAPWRPADVEQREGRILRQGNLNPEVKICRYVTEGSFDVYKWQLLQSKAKFIAQVMAGDLETRTVEDLDAITIGYAEMKALATGNPVLIERIKTEGELRKFVALRRAHQDRFAELQRSIRFAQQQIGFIERTMASYEAAGRKLAGRSQGFAVSMGKRAYTSGEKGSKQEAGRAFLAAYDQYKGNDKSGVVGEIHGCPIRVTGRGEHVTPKVVVEVTPEVQLPIEVGESPEGNITRLQNALDGLPALAAQARQRIAGLREQIAQETVEMNKPFAHKATVERLEARLAELDVQIAALSQNDPAKQQQVMAAGAGEE